jgi:hypothetical protein
MGLVKALIKHLNTTSRTLQDPPGHLETVLERYCNQWRISQI